MFRETAAHDFVLKDRLTRLAPAIQRELREAADRQRGREAETALRTSAERILSPGSPVRSIGWAKIRPC